MKEFDFRLRNAVPNRPEHYYLLCLHIVRDVCEYYGIEPQDLFIKRRYYPLSTARYVLAIILSNKQLLHRTIFAKKIMAVNHAGYYSNKILEKVVYNQKKIIEKLLQKDYPYEVEQYASNPINLN